MAKPIACFYAPSSWYERTRLSLVEIMNIFNGLSEKSYPAEGFQDYLWWFFDDIPEGPPYIQVHNVENMPDAQYEELRSMAQKYVEALSGDRPQMAS